MNINSLLGKINLFCKKATLLSDVATRILVSRMDQQSFNLPAGREAAVGAIDIINYTIIAIKSELKYYQKFLPSHSPENIMPLGQYLNAAIIDKPSKENIDSIIMFLKQTKELFSDYKNWEPDYGGKNWERIASAILDVAIKYKDYLNVKRNSEEEYKAIKNLIVSMNAFDGVAHNTGSIYTKLINIEGKNINRTRSSNMDVFKRLIRLRDLSESEYDIDVMKEIIPELGIQLPFKDYITDIKNKPDYYKDTFERREFIINRTYHLREASSRISDLYIYLENLIKKLNDFYDPKTHLMYVHVLDKPDSVIKELNMFLYLTDNLHNIELIADKLKDYNINIDNILNLYKKFYAITKNVYEKLDALISYDKINDEEKFTKLFSTYMLAAKMILEQFKKIKNDF